MDQTIGLIIFLGVNLILSVGLGFLFGKTNMLGGENKKVPKWLKYVIGIAVFGVLSVLGTILGASYDGAMLNTRDFGPVAGGIWFGPVIGIGSAIIGAVFRFTCGGITVIPCTIATLVSGILAGLVYLWFVKKGKQMKIWVAVVTAFVAEVLHLALNSILVDGGLQIALGKSGIGTLVLVVIFVFIFSITYKLSSKKSE